MNRQLLRLSASVVLMLVFTTVLAQQHLPFNGIPIDGRYESFRQRLIRSGFKYLKENEETSSPLFEGSLAGLRGIPFGLYVLSGERSDVVTEVSAYYYPESEAELPLKYDRLVNYIGTLYPTAKCVQYKYVYDETPEFGGRFKDCTFTVKGNDGGILGTICVAHETDMDENQVLTVSFVDHANMTRYGRKGRKMEPRQYDLSGYVDCASRCRIDIGYYGTEIFCTYNGRDYRFLAEGQDENLLKELMFYQNDKDVKASLLNTYVYSIVRNGIPEKTTFVSTSRMEKVIYAYVDAQQKLRQQKRVSARGALWGMLKDYLFTSEEKAHMDKTIPKDMQERMFMGIFGAVGGSGPTNFDMLSPAQQAVIHESSNGR